MDIKVLVNGSLYKTITGVKPNKDGSYDPKPINFQILEEQKLGLLDAFKPIKKIELVPA